MWIIEVCRTQRTKKGCNRIDSHATHHWETDHTRHYSNGYWSSSSEETKFLKAIISEQFETDLSWVKVVARKHKKSTYIEQRISHPLPVIPNFYNLLCNDMNGDKPQNSAERLRDLNSIYT